jgi:hypothetical protein
MAKTSGLGSSLIVATTDVSGDIGAINSIATMRAAHENSDITQSAVSRELLLRDGALSYNAWWDVATAHPVLSALPRTDQQTSYFLGAAVGNPIASMVGKQLTYAPVRGQDGSLVATINAAANGFGLEWGEMLTTGKQSFATGTVNGTSIDLGAVSTLFGAAGYLHVLSVASGTAVFAIQDSANNADFLDVGGLIFTGATGATTQRLQTAAGATIRQYVRVQGTGVHGAAVIVVNFVRYTEA